MKTLKFYFSVVLLALIISSCKEEGPDINLKPIEVDTSLIDTTYISGTAIVPQVKIVLIEDFTGVACPNCPNAAAKIDEIKNLYPNRILATAIHTKGIFGTPYDSSKFDFRTVAGLAIFDMLSGPKQWPIGCVNRVKHIDGNGNFVIKQDYSTWASYAAAELIKNTGVNIYLSDVLIDSTFKINVRLHYTQATADTQALTVYVIEDDIIDLQKLPDNNIDSHYVHKHVLRAVLSNYNGDDLKSNEGLVLNRVFEKEYKIKMDSKWVKSNCSIIAFVHKKGYYFDIVQAQSKAL